MVGTLQLTLPGINQLTREAGGWISCSVPQPDVVVEPIELLEQQPARQTGNQRLSIVEHQAYLQGEVHDAGERMSLEEAHRYLCAAGGATESPGDEVASVLGSTELEWKQDEDGSEQWSATASGPGEERILLATKIVASGIVEVRSALVGGETTGQSQAAIAQFLAFANSRIRFARFELNETGFDAVSFATAKRLDRELPDSVAAVIAASRLVRREVRALTDEAVAQMYLTTLTTTSTGESNDFHRHDDS